MPARRGSPCNCRYPVKRIWPRSAPFSIVFETPERWAKTRLLVKIHPFAPVQISVAEDIRVGHHVDPARARNIFARVLTRKQRQRLQLLRAHSYVFPALRPRNAKEMTQSASFRRTPNS
jgi:hypothetical protein